MLEKAATLDADEVFIDLEDAVPPASKNDATRSLVAAALNQPTWKAKTLAVRINAVGTPWCLDDLQTIVARAGNAIDCVIVPKVESAAHAQFVAQLLQQLELKHGLQRPIGIEVQIESPRGLVNITQIAGASPRIESLIFGPGDYAANSGMPHLTVGAIDSSYPGDAWHYVLSQIVTVARAFGLQAIDGPFAAIRDSKGFAEVANRSRVLGFDGKWALHPDQIPICNRTYSPTQHEFERARQILAAHSDAEGRGIGATVYGTEMIDEASRKMAASIVERGRAAGMASPAEAT